MRGGRVFRGAALLVSLAVLSSPAAPQEPVPRPRAAPETPAPPAERAPAPPAVPFLFIDQDRILSASRTGQTLLAEEEEARDRLRAEAREIDRRFEAEERRLTEMRPKTEPEEFRALAEAFDARVIEARRAQDRRSAELVADLEERRRQFYARLKPILVGLLSRYRAYAIFDESSVLLADQSLDITEAVIAEIDARAAQGEAAEPAPAED
jgi:Skp family chaperone for outer membrane proteins